MSIALSLMLKSTANQMLPAMAACLRKAADHAASNKIDESAFLEARLYPDMFGMGRQVQIATDMIARAAARLAKNDFLELPDTEKTFAELVLRIEKVRGFINGLDDQVLDAAASMDVEFPIGGGNTKTLQGGQYLLSFAFPNFYFHAATGYDLLRHNGVALGKRDFMMPPQTA